jgi:hypothetical protein
MDLLEEFRMVVTELEKGSIPYAICGGMAMAAYGHARATQDIDVLIAASSVNAALALISRLGYEVSARLTVGKGQVRMIRAIKAVGTDHLVVDILEASDADEETWTKRLRIETEFGPVWFVSKGELIEMKRRSGWLQDLADIERLEGNPE